MKRILSLMLVLTILLAFSVPAFADDPLPYTDVADHWALRYIEQVTAAGLMNGDTATTFSPDASITRGMFVTVLGRFAGINKDAWKMNYGDGVRLFVDVELNRYYSPYINWAARNGIAQGIGYGKFEPDAMITREQMMVMLKRYADVTGKTFQDVSVLGVEDEQTPSFTDTDEIASWARDAVNELRSCGIIQGISNEDGTLRFAPKSNSTRAQAATVFCRMLGTVTPKPGWKEKYATLVNLSQTAATLKKGEKESVTLKAQVFPADATNKAVTWFSTNPGVAAVGKTSATECTVNWIGAGKCTIWAYSANGCKASCDIVCEKPAPTLLATAAVPSVPQDLSLAYKGESYDHKCERIFGRTVSDPRTVYTSDAAARPNMVTITVPAWDMDSNGQKYTRQFTLTVHRNIAATVDQIFREIYACPAKYPIHSLGGYRYDDKSEHTSGLAIDINPNENYYCSPSGQALVGKFFSPSTSEYSIPVGGEIDQIFSKYGFTRGIYWRSGYKDYMHYSFFGT